MQTPISVLWADKRSHTWLLLLSQVMRSICDTL